MHLLWLTGLFSLHGLMTVYPWTWEWHPSRSRAPPMKGSCLPTTRSVVIFFSYISQDHLARVGTHCGAHRTVWWRRFLTRQSLFPANTGCVTPAHPFSNCSRLTLPGNVGPVDGSQLQFWSARLNSLTSQRPLLPQSSYSGEMPCQVA